DVPLLPVTAWVPPGGDLAERRHASPYLRKLWRDDAVKRQRAAFEAGLGGVFPPRPPGAAPGGAGGAGGVGWSRGGGGGGRRGGGGETGPVLVDPADQPDDLLIVGTGRRGGLGRLLHRSVSRYCLAHAKCPVLAIPPSPLMDEMSRGLRSWPLRRHALIPDTPDA